MNFINQKTITDIIVTKEYISTKFAWYPAQRVIFKKKPAGFYADRGWSYETYHADASTLPDCYVVKDNQVFVKPEVRITLLNDRYIERYFNTYDEALAFIDTLDVVLKSV
jgi:hypothetical protein